MAIIEVKNLGKKYRIGERERYLALRDVLAGIIKSPASWLKDKVRSWHGQEYWALKDVNFSVEKGEVLGIIGRNGAGKSTLLKILSQITPPTTGEIRLSGRVGSLLEVGTGFHPELTGRENIYLNGAILGMKKKEIDAKFDQIVDFSGIGEFLDTPVKRYSSGMYVRLAFSVAAHLEPDILIIDEVLAVGDAEFQKKCLGKMEEVAKTEGRTVLFVSHNMPTVEQLCKKCVLLDKGSVVAYGETKEIIKLYLNRNKNSEAEFTFRSSKNKEAFISKISLLNCLERPATQLPISEEAFIKVQVQIIKTIYNAALCLHFYSSTGDLLLLASDTDVDNSLHTYEVGSFEIKIKIPKYLFNVGQYHFEASLQEPFVKYYDKVSNINFEILDINNPKTTLFGGNALGRFAVRLEYEIKILK